MSPIIEKVHFLNLADRAPAIFHNRRKIVQVWTVFLVFQLPPGVAISVHVPC